MDHATDSAREADHDKVKLWSLSQGMAQGNDEAWKTFDREFGSDLLRYLIVIARGDIGTAQDALQQSYLKIAHKIRPTRDIHHWKNWIRSIARNTLLDLLRKQSRYAKLLDRECERQHAGGSHDTVESELNNALHICLEKLSSPQKKLLTLKYIQRQSVFEIADALGASPKAIESRLTRARACLQKELKRHLGTSNHV